MKCLRRMCRGVLIRHGPKHLQHVGEMGYRCSLCGKRFTELQMAMARLRKRETFSAKAPRENRG